MSIFIYTSKVNYGSFLTFLRLIQVSSPMER